MKRKQRAPDHVREYIALLYLISEGGVGWHRGGEADYPIESVRA